MKTLPSFTAQQSLFRAYDIRGDHQYFTTDFVAALAEVFARLYNAKSYYEQSNKAAISSKTATVVIGFDVRVGSDTIAKIVADILQTNGLTVINLGLVTTPMMAFWAQQYDGHGIMVTASHSAKNTLGVKWLLNNASPSSLEIQTLYQQLSQQSVQPTRFQKYNWQKQSWHGHSFKNYNLDSKNDSSAQNYYSKTNIELYSDSQNHCINLSAQLVANIYIKAINQAFKRIDKRRSTLFNDNHRVNKANLKPQETDCAKLDLTVVIDCMNGATSNIAQPLFERFCQRVIMLNDTPNGEFPIGNPDPTEPNRLAELQQAVIVSDADIGLAFDGDGDRLMIVDNRGKVIVADHLLYLLAQVAITERSISIDDTNTAPKVLFDIKCSHQLPHLLSQLGAEAIMTRTGSSLLRQELQNSASVTAPIFVGELSGHFIFNDGYFMAYDDAMYAGLRLLHWLTYTAPTIDILSSSINSTTDVWGEPRAAVPPYQLTDITQDLPTLVSSADHYLPLNQAFLAQNDGDSCTFIEHLVEYCHYLLDLLSHDQADAASVQQSIFAHSISCQCFSATAPMMKTRAEAQHLLSAETQICSIDGLRLDFDYGFGVIRRSNTSNCLTVRFAGDSSNAMKIVKARFVALCSLFDKELAKQMAAIEPE